MARQFSTIELTTTAPATRAALSAFVAYQTAQSIRRTLMGRLLLFVLGVGILNVGLRLLPVAALVVTSLIAGGMLAAAGTHERKARAHLLQELKQRRP